MNSNRTYYINQIQDLSTNFDHKTKLKILDELDKVRYFDFKGLKKLYDLLMTDVYGDDGLKGY
jgi:hypothetical protein|tara:strand:+ start:2508 stop:2696 length:189 start_codon:yes stop_codon:yes gene_type:complete